MRELVHAGVENSTSCLTDGGEMLFWLFRPSPCSYREIGPRINRAIPKTRTAQWLQKQALVLNEDGVFQGGSHKRIRIPKQWHLISN